MLCRLGRYWRIIPLVFSLVPRSQAWCGVAKQKRVSVARRFIYTEGKVLKDTQRGPHDICQGSTDPRCATC